MIENRLQENTKRDRNYYLECIRPYLNGDATTCSYCDKIDPLIIYRGRDFFITVAIGAYMPGYIQLCSNAHRTSATGILDEEYSEFALLSTAIRNSFFNVYGNNGICFEHGQAGMCLWKKNNFSSLCHHMHIHYLPISINIHECIKSIFPNFFVVHNIEEMISVRRNILCSEPYLYYSPTPEMGYMYSVADVDVPRQFLRHCVADKLGISEKADWCEYPGIEFYDQTKIDLSNAINEEVKKLVM